MNYPLSNRLRFIYSLLCLSTFVLHSAAICYYPDKETVAPQDTPCSDSTSQSTCCGQGYACLSNHICIATGDELEKANATKYIRGSCTDQRWRSSECPLFCIDPDVDNLTGGNGIGKCLGTTQDMYYCIDTGNTDNNCSASQNPLIFQGILNLVLDKSYILTYAGQPSALTTIGVTATSAATKFAKITTTLSTATLSASASASQTAATTQSTTADHTTAITAGVAAPLRVIALGLGAFLYYRYGRKQSNSKLIPSEYQAVPPPTYHDETVKYTQHTPESGPAGKQPHYEAPTSEIQEAPVHNALVELPNDSVSYELDVNSPTQEGSRPPGHTQ